ncbi:hypothetical protein L9F63_005831, partial [Diploptera punctata]
MTSCVTQALCGHRELVLSPAGDGSQCSGSHGQGRTQETNREHEISGNNGALAIIEEHSRHCQPYGITRNRK